ncbi:MAG: site-specific integrase [Luteibacter sp.]
MRGRIESVLAYATVAGYRAADKPNPARWKGHLAAMLAKPSKVKRVEHHAALPYAELPAFMKKLRAEVGMGALALEFAILTATRTGEVIGATWSEFDLESATWCIPAERMKATREHRVPLSPQAVALLEKMQAGGRSPDGFVFPGLRPGKPLSNMAMLATLKRMKRGDLTTHGFRSTFRDWAGETTAHPREVIEHALAHRLKDKAEAAYQRGTLMAKRRLLMDDWSHYCG